LELALPHTHGCIKDMRHRCVKSGVPFITEMTENTAH
jgi:hypothetical protein